MGDNTSNGNGQSNGHSNGINGHSFAEGCPVKQGNVGGYTRNYEDDRAAKSQDVVYTASNGCPVPHPYGKYSKIHETGRR